MPTPIPDDAVAKSAAPETLGLFFELTKVDEQKREVWGRATAERPDRVREIMDYATSVPHFKAWSADALERSTKAAGLPDSAKSLGNIREMHQPIAAGKVIDIQFNDAEKAIDIGTYCANDETWQKILNGTLTGFSIGGTARRWLDPANPSYKRFTAFPAEISYVDSPALPSATFQLIKADGTTELRKVGMPADPAPDPDEADDDGAASDDDPPDEAAASAAVPETEPEASVKAAGVTHALDSLLALYKAADARETRLNAIGERAGIARRAGEPLTPPKDYPTHESEYGDPANHAWPLNDAARVTAALGMFNGGKGRDAYTEPEWAALGRRIASRASALLGARHSFRPETHPMSNDKEHFTMDDMSKADIGALLSQLMTGMRVMADQIPTNPDAARAQVLSMVGDLETRFSTAQPIDAAMPPGTLPAAVPGYTPALIKAETPAPPAPDMGKVESLIDARLTAFMGDLTKALDARLAPATPASQLPVGDLAALLNQAAPETEADDVLAMLTSGDRHAMLKAAQLAGTPEHPDLNAVNERVDKALNGSLRTIYGNQLYARWYGNFRV